MKRVLFYSSHTLYLKSLAPLIEGFVREGAEVHLSKNRPDWMGYHPRMFGKKPTRNIRVNRAAYEYVSGTLDAGDSFSKTLLKTKTVFPTLTSKSQYDVILSTFKDTPTLLSWKNETQAKLFTVGYYHFPIFQSLRDPFKRAIKNPLCDKVFFGSNAFSEFHGFSTCIDPKSVISNEFLNYTYLDWIEKRPKPNGPARYVLIFHPGGYRGIETQPGDSRSVSYQKQKELILKTCLPVLEAGLIPVLKTHPLYARFHSAQDLELLKSELIKEHPGLEKLIISEHFYWDYAYQSKFIVSFGSSSLYELFAAGLKNILVCHFIGNARAKKFSPFPTLTIETEKQYRDLLLSESQTPGAWNPTFQGLEAEIFQAYSTLPRGHSVNRVLEESL